MSSGRVRHPARSSTTYHETSNGSPFLELLVHFPSRTAAGLGLRRVLYSRVAISNKHLVSARAQESLPQGRTSFASVEESRRCQAPIELHGASATHATFFLEDIWPAMMSAPESAPLLYPSLRHCYSRTTSFACFSVRNPRKTG